MEQDYKALLGQIKDLVHGKFKGPAAVERLEIFDRHLATVEMVIDQLYESAEKGTAEEWSG